MYDLSTQNNSHIKKLNISVNEAEAAILDPAINALLRNSPGLTRIYWTDKKELKKALGVILKWKLSGLVNDIKFLKQKYSSEIVDYVYNTYKAENPDTSMQESSMKLSNLLPGAKKEILRESLSDKQAAENFVRSMIQNYNKIHGVTLPVQGAEYQSLAKELQFMLEASFQDGFTHGMKQGIEK